MQKPIEHMTSAEKARLRAHLQTLVEAEGDFPGVLGNRNSFFIARPARRRKPAARKPVRVTA